MGACQAPTFGKRARYAIMAGNHDVCAAQDTLPLYPSTCRDRRGQDGASTAAPVSLGPGGSRGEGVRDA
jgi:hypothetical protein